MKKFGLFIFIILSLSSCSSPHQHELKISTTIWIGYTPLFYAKEKGWLKNENIKLINVVSLSENMYLYRSGNAHAYCGTQYEYSVLKDKIPGLMPIMLFDRSYGGDIIMSNQTIKSLQESNASINTYLEMDSINITLLNDFIQRYNIDDKRIKYIDRDQVEISQLINAEPEKQILIITYIPFDTILKKNGFDEILSTKNGLELLVVDAMYTQKDEFNYHKEQFLALKKLTDKAIEALKKDPQEFYATIKPYMNNLSYEEFSEGLHDIQWINTNRSKEFTERLHQASFPLKDLL